jgi:cytoskeleton protein RodZ
MSEEVPAADTTSAGKLLREAREAAGLHVATLAANLKVPVRKLEALEEDRYDLLPDAVFVRALASSVCRTLKIDPQPVLSRLPQTTQPRLMQASEGINAPFRAPGDGPQPGLVDQLSRPVVLTVVALLLGALVLIFLPMAQDDAPAGSQQVAASPPPEPPASPPAQLAAPAATAQPQSIPAPTAVVTPAAVPAPAPSGLPAAPAPTGAAATAVAPATPAAMPAAPVASAGTPITVATTPAVPADGIVVFRTRGPSWVQVQDAGGATVLRRLLNAGETVAANGKLPLSVTIGDASQTEVQVRGQAYDLGPIARDNVARFEVK